MISKEDAKRIAIDKTLLVLTGLSIGIVLLGLMAASDRYMSLTREGMLFLGGFITYNGTVCYLLWRERRRRLNSISRKLIALVLVQAPLVLPFGIIYYGLVPAPASMLPYWLGTVVLAPIVVEGIRFLFRPRR